LLYVWWLLAWAVRPAHFFFADDWDWLFRAALLPRGDQFTLLPRYAYNDRPVGALVFRVLYAAFGINSVPFHWTLLLLHLVNTTLVLILAGRLLRSRWLAMMTALAYGGWSAAIEAASWMAAIFDGLANTLVLLTILTFSSRRWAVRAASVVLFYLAVRTKETAIVTPVLLVVVVFMCHPRKEWTRELARTLWPHLALLLLFAAVYLPLVSQHQGAEAAASPYRMTFTAQAFFQGVYEYTSMMLYGRPWPAGRLIRWACILALFAVGIARGSRATVVGLSGFLIFLLPVVFLPHQRQALYLYIPAVFFVLALGGGAEAIRMPEPWRERAAIAIILLCVVTLPHRSKMQARADWLLAHTIRARSDIDSFRTTVPSLREGARIALIGFPMDYHVFQTQGCPVLKVYYRVRQVSCDPAVDASDADVSVRWHPDRIEVTAAGK
jgi:hypothetical protein